MIVELYGCPGCGKTYLIHKLTGNDKTVAMSDNQLKKFLINIAKKISLYTPESINLKKKIATCIADQNQKALFINLSVQHFINKLVLLSFGYNHIKRNIFMAEGLIHRIVSMAVNFGWGDDIVDKIISSISNILNNVQPVYLFTDIRLCFDSIKKRNRHEVEMDELPDERLKLYLENYKKLFDHITDKYGYLKITRNNYSELKELLK